VLDSKAENVYSRLLTFVAYIGNFKKGLCNTISHFTTLIDIIFNKHLFDYMRNELDESERDINYSPRFYRGISALIKQIKLNFPQWGRDRRGFVDFHFRTNK